MVLLRQKKHIFKKAKKGSRNIKEELQEKEYLVVRIELLDYHIIKYVFLLLLIEIKQHLGNLFVMVK
jgi:hypothetical protein